MQACLPVAAVTAGVKQQLTLISADFVTAPRLPADELSDAPDLLSAPLTSSSLHSLLLVSAANWPLV